MIPDAAAPAVTTQAARGAGIVGSLRPTAARALIGHREDLDGVRGLAIALVLVEHTLQARYGLLDTFGAGLAGVTIFFVLSGFLITSLLMREDPIDVPRFYGRRAVRLGPALLLMLVFTAVVGTVQATDWIPGVAASLLYVNNWAHVAGWDVGIIGHTWSLAIEEQFYVLWPLTMIIVPRRFLLPLAVVLAIAGTAAYRQIGYYSSFSNGAAILAGAALALSGLRLPRAAGFLGIALIGVIPIVWAQWMAVVGTLLLIAAPIGPLRPLPILGRRAYSLYLWHVPLISLLGVAGLPVAFIVAEASYRVVERPIIRRFHARLTPRRA